MVQGGKFMTSYFGGVSFYIFLVLACVAQDAADKEIKRLEGKYKAVSIKAGDKQLPEGLVDQIRLVIKGNSYDSQQFGSKQPGFKLIFMIDPSKNPKQIDFTTKDMKVMKCIYELSGNTLRIAKSFGDENHPKDFDSEKYTIEVWQRLKD
jgi:uncharacterized protein (TIGR03067 family)